MLNFELPLSQTRFAAGTVLPVAGTLAQPLTLPAGTILAAAVHDANGALLYPAGALLAQGVTLPADARLGAGSVLAATATLAPLRWPAGAAARVDGRRQAVPAGVGRQAEPAARRAPAVRHRRQAARRREHGRAARGQGRHAGTQLGAGGDAARGLAIVGFAAGRRRRPGAADPRAVGVDPRAGHVVLADTHYAARVVDNIKIMITEEGELMGMGPRGTEVPEGFLGVCEWLPEACETVAVKREVKVWSQAAQDSQPDRIAGTDVPKGALAVCDLNPAFCDIRLEITKTASVLGQNYSAAHGHGRSGRGRVGRCAAGVALRRLHRGHRVGGHGSCLPAGAWRGAGPGQRAGQRGR